MHRIVQALVGAGATDVFQIGGTVRDRVLGVQPKDQDIEVWGLSFDRMAQVISAFGEVDLCGKQFLVAKLSTGEEVVDFSVPRKDSKFGLGHQGFEVEAAPLDVTPEEAFSRRDFTMNAMGRSLVTGKVVDPFGGMDDLEKGILRHTSDAFAEDPLRVLRGMQFVSRFFLRAAPETLSLCRSLVGEFPTLSKERVWVEFEKMAVAPEPEAGLKFLRDCGWLECFPLLEAMVGCEQAARHHPEGSVWAHTLMVVAEASFGAEFQDREDKVVLVMAALVHDIGKPFSDNGRHSRIGSELAAEFLDSIGCPLKIAERIVKLVQEHMCVPHTDAGIRRLAVRLEPESIINLARLQIADRLGRGRQDDACLDEIRWLEKRAHHLLVADQVPGPLVTGRHLLSFMAPGPEMGKLLKLAFEAQLDGAFSNTDEGVSWIVNQISPF